MNKKIAIPALIGSLFLFTGCNNQPKPVVLKQFKVKRIVPVHKYIYSNKHVEYADVPSIERLKKATVILIDKVNSFEKILETKIPNREDLTKLKKETNLSIEDKNRLLVKTINSLKRVIAANSRKIKTLEKIKVTRRPLHVVPKSVMVKPHQNSIYDKKILNFLNNNKK